MTEKIDIDNQADPNDPRTEPEKEADRKIEALELELANLQPGVQVILERLRPSWCKGQLEKITVSDEGLDLDYIIRTWGGQLISVKIVGKGGRICGSHSVELYTFEPRRFGKILKEPSRPGEDDEAGYQPPPSPQQIVSGPSNELSIMEKVFTLMNAQRQSEIDTLRAIVTAQLQNQVSSTPATAPAVQDPLRELLKAANTYRQLEGIFGPKETPQLGGEEQFPAQIMEMAKMLFDKSGQQPRAQLVEPQLNPRPIAPPPKMAPSTPAPAPAPAPVTPIREKPELASMLSGLNANEAAETLIMALGKMDPNKQDDTIEAFMDKFRETMPEFFEEDDSDAAEGGNNSGGQ